MTEQAWSLTWLLAVTLVPMAPAIGLYYVIPSSGDVEGPWQGLKVKFSGAVAAYLVIFFALLWARPAEASHYHTWTVRGTVAAEPAPGDPEPNLNDLYVRFVPPRLGVMNQGAFEWEVPVIEDAAGRLQFPSLQLDLRGYRGLTIPLGPSASYGGVVPAMDRDESARLLVLKEPVRMVSSRAGQAYAPGPSPGAQASPGAVQP